MDWGSFLMGVVAGMPIGALVVLACMFWWGMAETWGDDE